MMIQRESWRPRCRLCDKAGGKISGCHGKPISMPKITGKCPYSPDGKHRPMWEQC